MRLAPMRDDGCAADHLPRAHRRRVHQRVFLLADDLAYRAPGDPELVFVVAMCSYATDIAQGLLPGPFDAADARRYARAFLIPEVCSSVQSSTSLARPRHSACRPTSSAQRAPSTAFPRRTRRRVGRRSDAGGWGSPRHATTGDPLVAYAARRRQITGGRARRSSASGRNADPRPRRQGHRIAGSGGALGLGSERCGPRSPIPPRESRGCRGGPRRASSLRPPARSA